MRVSQGSLDGSADDWTGADAPLPDANLVLYFGIRGTLADRTHFDNLKQRFPGANLIGCSTGGQIVGDDVTDDGIAVTAIHFDRTPIRVHGETLDDCHDAHACGRAIGEALADPALAGIFVLSDGLRVNGSKLVTGITESIGRDVPLTGGLAGDGSAFEETLVGADCPPRPGMVAAVGFYGPAIRFGHGSAAGWDVFGPRRRITRASGNVLYELDGEPALDLYKRYLGPDESQGLPGTALLFPLQIFDPKRADHWVVRTVLAVDHDRKTMTFAGDVPEGWVAQLMRGNFDRLAAGAADAARQANMATDGDGVAILVSCIGRRLLMGQRVTDEVEAAAAEFDPRFKRLGFYSYGEISPHGISGMCELHNQTMTVTTLTEADAPL